jgi:hypothetical protein
MDEFPRACCIHAACIHHRDISSMLLYKFAMGAGTSREGNAAENMRDYSMWC